MSLLRPPDVTPPAPALSHAVARAFATRSLTFDAPAIALARSCLLQTSSTTPVSEAVAALAVLVLADPASPEYEAMERSAQSLAIAHGTPDECLRAATLVLYRLAWLRGTSQEWHTLDTAMAQRGDLDRASPSARITWVVARTQAAMWLIDGLTGRTATDVLSRGAALARSHGIDPRASPLATTELLLALVRRDEEAAAAVVGASGALISTQPEYDASQRSLLLAWYHLNGARIAAAEVQAARAVALAERGGVPCALAWAMLARAAVLATAGKRSEALRTLGVAGRLARRLRADHVSVVRAHLLATLCKATRRSNIERRLGERMHRPFALPLLSAFARPQDAEVAAPGGGMVVRTLGTFAIEINGTPLRWSGKTPRRPLEVLKLVIAGNGEVPVERILDALWPGHEADKAYRALVSALHRLRQLTGVATIELRDGALRLRNDQVWVDALDFERSDEDAPLDLYKGSFLNGDDAEWVIVARERLRFRYAARVEQAATRLVQASRHADALALYMRALELEPLREGFYQGALVCCAARGLRAESSALYERCRSALANGLGLRPSSRTEALYREIVSRP